MSLVPSNFDFIAEPVPPFNPIEIRGQTTDDTISVVYTAITNGQFDHYQFIINDTSDTEVTKKKSDTDTQVRFTGLEAGTLYRVTAYTVSGPKESGSVQTDGLPVGFKCWNKPIFSYLV